MKVLTVMISVSNLSEEQIDDLLLAMEAQSEGLDATILNSGVREIQVELDD